MSVLSGVVRVGNSDVPAVGAVCWWNCNNVRLTQQQFGSLLRQVGLSDRYARDHNWRSTFIRCLHQMEEKRIIRQVEADAERLVYQFTAEEKVNGDEAPFLEYRQETVVVIDKNIYAESGNFELAIVKGKPEIKARIVAAFEVEKSKYNSSDMSRYLQKIFRSEADILSLRPQGSVYFVPIGFQRVVESVSRLSALIPGVTFEHVPILDVEASRMMVRNAAEREFESLLEELDKEIRVTSDMPVTARWLDTRRNRLTELRKRLDRYQEVLDESNRGRLDAKFKRLEKVINTPRVLDL